jgi:hypothetical protein
MLKFNPDERITAEEALEHPYFDDIKRKGYINTYRQNNQHFFGPQVTSSSEKEQKEVLKEALRPIPLNANLEKIGESSDHIRQNVRKAILMLLLSLLCLFSCSVCATFFLCFFFLSFFSQTTVIVNTGD